MKQTAVEWIFENSHIVPKTELNKRKLIEKAKEIEKQQIMESYKDSTCQFSVDSRIDCPKSAEQYYNETFKNK